MDRRSLLKALSVTSMGVLMSPVEALSRAPASPLYLSALTDDRGNHAAVFDEQGVMKTVIDLPDRGHGGAFAPRSEEAVIFARRPGTFGVVFNRHTGRIIASLSSPEGRHFYGHGIYSPDGRLLYTTENDYEAGAGVIGIWDVAGGYNRLGECPSFGIDPHDIRLMSDGKTLAIANGGILTHPALDRQKLNIPEMAPSLVLVDPAAAALMAEVKLPPDLHKLSIRHMGVNALGHIGIAMQYEGPDQDLPPLAFIWRGGEPQLLEAPQSILRRMTNYCGSAALDATGTVLAISSPRGNIMTFWSMNDGALIETADIEDGCGVAAAGDRRFLLSSGAGERRIHNLHRPGEETRLASVDGHWDNHIIPGSTTF
ncbi:hypothetical protein FHS85_004344 [Rhodoligotrophos appendicifer]|uniref:DUF1513 domain-containing protein n=1 Tax=Rhodoligotrophos appendicifer TaxID=987056 RepID=UPI0011865855|nr:DUF1513 domain-containing protein [Rhodoligotrophos appendicifer]